MSYQKQFFSEISTTQEIDPSFSNPFERREKPPLRDKTLSSHLRNFFRCLFKAGKGATNLAVGIPSVARRYGAAVSTTFIIRKAMATVRKGYWRSSCVRAKVFLQPGESKKVTITLDRRSLAYYDVSAHAWDVARGVYRILVGSSSQDIGLQGAVLNLFPSQLSVLESKPVPVQNAD